jgi:hypothetical protein
LAKRPFLSHGLPEKILPDLSEFRSSDFQFFGFHNNIFLQFNSVSLAFNSEPGGPGLCIYVPQWHGGPVIPPASGSHLVASYDSTRGFLHIYWFFFLPLAPTLEHMADFSVSWSFTKGRTPWTGDQLVARPLPVHKHRKTHTHKH